MLTEEDRQRGRETRRKNYLARQELARKKKEAEKARLEYALDKMRLPDRLTTKQASEVIGVTPKTIREWIKQGKLKAYRFRWQRSRIYLSTAEVQELVRSKGSGIGKSVKKTTQYNPSDNARKECLPHIDRTEKSV